MTQERRAARFSLSPKTLKEALHMPDESEVYGVEWSFSDRMIYVYVNDPSFQLIPEGCSVPLATLVLTEPEFPDGVITGEWK